MRQIIIHGHDMILDIAEVEADFAPRSHLPILVASLRETLDDICLVAEQTVQAHHFLTALADLSKNVAAALELIIGIVALVVLISGIERPALPDALPLGLRGLLVLVNTLSIVGGGDVQVENLLVDLIHFLLNCRHAWAIYIGDVVDEGIADPVGSGRHVVIELADAPPDVGGMRGLRVVEGDDAVSENDGVKVDGIHVVLALLVLLKGPIVQEVVGCEQLHLLPLLLHEDVLGGKLVDAESLGQHFHLRLRRLQDVQPECRPRTVSSGFCVGRRSGRIGILANWCAGPCWRLAASW